MIQKNFLLLARSFQLSMKAGINYLGVTASENEHRQ
jgi:hypothetical protein